MTTSRDATILVTGATGRQGGAVTRHLLKDGWRVRALTRVPTSAKARELAELGADVVQGDMRDISTLRPVVDGAYGLYSVQNPMTGGLESEIQQGKAVADVARSAGVKHVVYGSAGLGIHGTGIGSWESKLEVEEHVSRLDLPVTILRPMAFMELMTDPAYYPAVSTWHIMPKLMGDARPVGWLAVDDLGAMAARAFAEPSTFIGQELQVASDVQSIAECREIYRKIYSKTPRRFPMPIWLFERFVGRDLTTMWRWLRDHEFELETEPTRELLPDAQSVEAWLRMQKSARP